MFKVEENGCVYKVWLSSSQKKEPRGYLLTWNAWTDFVRLCREFGCPNVGRLLSNRGRVRRDESLLIAAAMGRASSVIDVDPWFEGLREFVRRGGFTWTINH